MVALEWTDIDFVNVRCACSLIFDWTFWDRVSQRVDFHLRA